MEAQRSPEDVLRDFLVANLRPDEATIRGLIVDHPDADILWQGSYPEDVATLLAEQYEGMGMARVQEGPDRVLIRCSALPIPLAVVKGGGAWRVDASPIIGFRKAAQGDDG